MHIRATSDAPTGWRCSDTAAVHARRTWAADTNACLQRLPLAQQTVLRLVYQHNRSEHEISRLLELPASEVRQLAAAGLASLAVALLGDPIAITKCTSTTTPQREGNA